MTGFVRFVLVLVLLLVSSVDHIWCQAVSGQQKMTVLHAAHLLDIETGRLVSPGEVVVEGDRIRQVGAKVDHPAGAERIDLGDRTLMPGLIDAHVHLFLHPGAEDLQTVEESVPQRTIMAVWQLELT
jgi:imidazolonepropionase-like amidohydrolase